MLKADERIEKLLNRFGQTISDLPKPQKDGHTYWPDQVYRAYKTANKWGGHLSAGDYICHLADVIDRMETALNTALRYSSCTDCIHFREELKDSICQRCIEENSSEYKSEFRIEDCMLTGMHRV